MEAVLGGDETEGDGTTDGAAKYDYLRGWDASSQQILDDLLRITINHLRFGLATINRITSVLHGQYGIHSLVVNHLEKLRRRRYILSISMKEHYYLILLAGQE